MPEPLTLPANENFLSIMWGLGFFAKIIVLVLIVFSIISWAIIIKKFFLFRKIRKTNLFLYSLFKDRSSVLDFNAIATEYPESPLSQLVFTAVEEWRKIYKANNPVTQEQTNLLNLLPNISDALNKTASLEIDRLEQNLPFLATCGSVAPFLGLLGTVWGVLQSFLGVRHIPVVTLQIIAPGISDALITTVAGLLVAIPAVIAYNYFVGKIKSFSNDMERWILEIESDLRKIIVLSD
ncbi:MAG: MotA/TolQ/ExbB proton channel family protein [candidate division WOR-3 bacterium]|nr:MotA/TolQ/ExbB proton channel family protein [candidate division WOR-3 bacterium]